jgi:hypothetical protein
VLAALVGIGAPADSPLRFEPALLGAMASYGTAVCWLYERPRAGLFGLFLVAVAALLGAFMESPRLAMGTDRNLLDWLAPPAGGLVLGTTTAAMLLGHWYLNSPGMQIAPLERLIKFMAVAITVQAVLAGVGLAMNLSDGVTFSAGQWTLLGLRWIAGLAGSGLMAAMAWRTLKIPNTQSATGILYVAVMFTFLGELAAELLSAESRFPL